MEDRAGRSLAVRDARDGSGTGSRCDRGVRKVDGAGKALRALDERGELGRRGDLLRAGFGG